MINATSSRDACLATTLHRKANLNAPRAIIAEDEPLLRDEIEDALVTLWPELQITARVADGIAVLRELDRQIPDILFLDIQMPGGTGIVVLERLKASSKTWQIPVIVLSGSTDPKAADTVKALGAAEYLTKPVVVDQLLAAVARALGLPADDPTPDATQGP